MGARTTASDVSSRLFPASRSRSEGSEALGGLQVTMDRRRLSGVPSLLDQACVKAQVFLSFLPLSAGFSLPEKWFRLELFPSPAFYFNLRRNVIKVQLIFGVRPSVCLMDPEFWLEQTYSSYFFLFCGVYGSTNCSFFLESSRYFPNISVS